MSAIAEGAQNRGESTSPGLSSPPSPNSPTQNTPTPHAQPNSASFAQNGQSDANVGGGKSMGTMGAKSTSARKGPRKKKDPEIPVINNGNASTATDGQEKPRKRAPRGTSAAYKKKQAKLAEEAQAQARAREAAALQGPRQTKLEESLPTTSLPPPHFDVPAIHAPPQSGNCEAIPIPQPNAQTSAPHSRPASGQNYDPIRSSTVAPNPSSPLSTVSTPQKPPIYPSPGASAPSSIYSLMEQPAATMSPYNISQQPRRDNDTKAPSPPEAKRPRLSPPIPILPQHRPVSTPKDVTSTAPPLAPTTSTANVIELDSDKSQELTNNTMVVPRKPSPKASTGVSSSSHSPKPSGRQKEAPPPLPSGSGLLSGAIFGGGYDSSGVDKTAPTVVLDVRLDGDNHYVNFTRLAEERYGFNALHPRLAAQRERLARVAAAGAALENAHKNGGNSGSGDEMSVDLSDAEADNSNVEMGGMIDGDRIPKSGEETGEAGIAKKPRKRMMKEDMYDKEDDFIDDTELIWEEQAATSKDGFFVYSGPLIPPGEEPTVERTEPTKRGRGGGRGRGGATRGGARGAAKDGVKVPGRKPRVTKAMKEQIDREKAQRENLAVLASKPAGYVNPLT
ncbi:hypothetical protein N7G274_002072 [Stereocaulon virgatum]|uniref:Hpc2-related domain-containing protein n=1 Tax=Stereocaulon virgatum TaxID=373712 RepID=A0ABR4AIN8_9LECA